MNSTHTTHERFKSHFPDPHSIVVALHAKSISHALEQADIALTNGADGIALVTHHPLSPNDGYKAIEYIKHRFPYNKAIINVLQKNPEEVFIDIYNTGLEQTIDGVRTDNAYLPGVDWVNNDEMHIAEKVKNIKLEQKYQGLYFGGLNFKHQKQTPPEELGVATKTAKAYLDIITTSGPSTGHSANPQEIAFMKSIIGDYPFAIASGVTAENLHEFAPHLDLTFVNTGVSKNYNDLDEEKVKLLMKKRDKYNTDILKKQYGDYMLQKYNMISYPALQMLLEKTGIINIGGGHHKEIEKMLSNLYPAPFILDGIEYASVEAFWMSIKYPLENEKHFIARGLSGIEAKRIGNEAKYIKSFQYNGHIIHIGSPEHHSLLKRAIREKLEQNPHIAQALKETGNRPITHILFDKDMNGINADSKTIPGEIFAKIVMDLRKELQQS